MGNERPKASAFRTYIIGALVVLFSIGAVYSYFKFMKTLEFSATVLYEQAFLDPPSAVTDLSGNQNNSMVGFDAWIRFKSASAVHLHHIGEFKPELTEVGRAAFAQKYENDPSLHQSPDSYEYLVRTEHEVGKVINEAMLVNKNTHEYFYRRWGM